MMSVRDLRAKIDAAYTQLHEAGLIYYKTPARYKYLEVSQLALRIEQMKYHLGALQIEAKLVHQQVLKREGKNPNTVK